MRKIRQKYIRTTYDYREDLHLMGLNCQQINLFFLKYDLFNNHKTIKRKDKKNRNE